MTLVARATDAKIRLRRIKHRRVQTAAEVLCRGFYVVGFRAALWRRRGKTGYNSRGSIFLLFSGISARFLFLYPRGDFLLVSSKKQKKINFFIKGEPLARFPILLHYNFVFSLILLIIPSSSLKEWTCRESKRMASYACERNTPRWILHWKYCSYYFCRYLLLLAKILNFQGSAHFSVWEVWDSNI